jgi:hypothetical protein
MAQAWKPVPKAPWFRDGSLELGPLSINTYGPQRNIELWQKNATIAFLRRLRLTVEFMSGFLN